MSNNEINKGFTEQIIDYDDEETVWVSSPSQWINLGYFILYGGLFVASSLLLLKGEINSYFGGVNPNLITSVIVTVIFSSPLIILYHYYSLKYTVTRITKNQIIESRGITKIFNQIKRCEMADVIDFKSPPAGLLGLVGRATLIIITKDADQELIEVRGIKDRNKLVKILNPLRRKLRIDRRTFFNNE